MLPDPLHPAVVHLPIALAVFLPVVALVAIWRIHRGAAPRPLWAVATAVFAALAVSAWVAVQTGEKEEHRVERAVAEAPLESHEHAAERFLVFSTVVLGIAAVGLVRGRIGATARLAATAGALGLLAAGVQVGHSGGELVYRHGAASAYVEGANATALSVDAADDRGDREDRERDHR